MTATGLCYLKPSPTSTMEFFRKKFFSKIHEKTPVPESLLIKSQTGLYPQKQSLRGVLCKRCSENIQQIYRSHPCRSVLSIKLFDNFIEITFFHGCSPVSLLHIFRTPFRKNTSGRLLLYPETSLKERTPTQVVSD